MLCKTSGSALRRRALTAALAGLGVSAAQGQNLALPARDAVLVIPWSAPSASYLVAAADVAPARDVTAAPAPINHSASPVLVAAPPLPSADILALKPESRLNPERGADDSAPTFVQGLKISGEIGKETIVEGEAELRKRGTSIKADRIDYRPEDDQMHAAGSVRVYRSGDLFTGTDLNLKLDAQTGVFLKSEYLLANDRARGSAEKMNFLGKDNYQADDAVYTTCGPGNDDWYLQVKELKLDYGRDLGEAEGAKLYFKGMNILSVPGISFALNSRRKSGFLAPSFGSTIQSGQEVSIPYYWNIAPNRDMTITPRFMTKRGLQTNLASRFIGDDYQGEARLEWLPNDKLTRTNRSGFSLLHKQNLGGGWSGNLNVNKVSDDTYFTDLSSRITQTSQRTLTREGTLNYAGSYYGLSGRIQTFQTLQDILAPVTAPYHRVPQINFGARRFDVAGLDLNFTSDYTRFTHPTQVMGNRVVVNPSVSYPWLSPGGYVTPKVSLHSTKYFLQQNAAGTPDSFTRTVPQFSLDSGLVFERDASYFGQSYTQTLEPRAYYLRVPGRDQSRFPVFDSGNPDLNFAQIFTDNFYSGQDRIADANQVTVGFTSRLIGTDKANERMRFALAQRFYFTDQKVTLPGEVARTDRTSDILASVSGEVAPKLLIDTALQYNPNHNQTGRVSIGARWSPELGRTISAAYRYRRDSLENVDFASQWKFGSNWYAVGRYNYSIKDQKVVEALAGFEYDGGCWVGRFVMQRFATATQRATTAIFFQLELNGLSRLGSNPLDQLRRNIPGYTKLNEHQTPLQKTMDHYE